MRAAVAAVQTTALESPLRLPVELEEVVTERFLLLPQQQGKQIRAVVAVEVALAEATAYQVAPVS